MKRSILYVLLLIFCIPVFAKKTDKLVLLNGDEITCEIKILEFGLLTAKTDDIGTLSIKWERVSYIISKEYFEIELKDGSKYFGPLIDSNKDQVIRVLLYDSSMVDLTTSDVVVMNQIMAQFLDRITGSVDVGFDIQKANSLSRLTLDAKADYRYLSNSFGIMWNSVFTNQQDTISNERVDLDFRYHHRYKNRWLFEAYSTLQHNSELGLDLRFLGGLGPGRTFVQSNQLALNGIAGLVFNKEWNAGVENSTNNLEGWIRLEYRQFVYISPKVDIFTTVEYFPNLTTANRQRFELYGKAKREVISNLHLILSAQYSYDSKSPSTGQAIDDWVFSFGVGYTF